MRKLVILTFLLVVTGCAALVGVRPTDIAPIHKGSSRADVEAILGQNVARIQYNDLVIDTYRYDRGVEFGRGTSGVYCNNPLCVAIAPFYWAHLADVSQEIANGQKGNLSIAFDVEDTVYQVFFELSGPETIEFLSNFESKRDHIAAYRLWRSTALEPGKTRWLCYAAHTGATPAMEAMGDAQLTGGLSPYLPMDKVMGCAWWLISVDRNDYEVKRDWAQEKCASLSLEQMRLAKSIAANWRANPESCEKITGE